MSINSSFASASVPEEEITQGLHNYLGISITVHDEEPSKVHLGLMKEWSQPVEMNAAHRALLSELNDHLLSVHKGSLLDNHALLVIGQDSDRFMLEKYPSQYSGHVRIRRANKVGNEIRYRYIAGSEAQ